MGGTIPLLPHLLFTASDLHLLKNHNPELPVLFPLGLHTEDFYGFVLLLSATFCETFVVMQTQK